MESASYWGEEEIPNLRWMDGVSRALDVRDMNVEQGREMEWNRNECKRLVYGER